MATAEAIKAKRPKKKRKTPLRLHRRRLLHRDPERMRRYQWEQVFDNVMRALIENDHPTSNLVETAAKLADEAGVAHETRFKTYD